MQMVQCNASVAAFVCLVPQKGGSHGDVPSERKYAALRPPKRYQSREQENQSMVSDSHSP